MVVKSSRNLNTLKAEVRIGLMMPVHHSSGCDFHFFHLCFLWRSHKKNKYRWFKVEGFGDGYVVVGKFRGVRCPLSQRVSCVKLRKAAVAM